MKIVGNGKQDSQHTKLDWRHFDFWLLGAVALLVIFGVTMIRSALAGNIENDGSDQNQLLFAGVGLVAILILASIDYRTWASTSGLLYGGAIALLGILLVVGGALFGSARWFQVGPVLLQPSEFAKIVMILVLANYFAVNQHRMGEIRVLWQSLVMTLLMTALILLQPNLSTSIVMVVLWFSLLWAAGLRVKHLFLFGGIGAGAAAVLVPLLIQLEVIKEYQLGRVTTFFFPDPNATYGEGYNIQQALISIGSGGLFGQGYGHGTQVQLRYLKVRWSDFIFSSLSQEFGFVGAVAVIAVLLFVVYRCLRAARLARDTYGGLICYGVATLLVLQAMVNIGVNLKLLPATGLTLPFVSYGGSSLLSNLIAIGLVESVIMRHKALEF